MGIVFGDGCCSVLKNYFRIYVAYSCVFMVYKQETHDPACTYSTPRSNGSILL